MTILKEIQEDIAQVNEAKGKPANTTDPIEVTKKLHVNPSSSKSASKLVKALKTSRALAMSVDFRVQKGIGGGDVLYITNKGSDDFSSSTAKLILSIAKMFKGTVIPD